MSAVALPPAAELIRQGMPPMSAARGTRVYAIAFDMDTESPRPHYGDPYNGAYTEIRRVLERFGFRWQQASTYFGNESIMP